MPPTPPAIRTLTQQDLDWLVCPACHGPLQLAAPTAAPAVLCPTCHLQYPILDGLPVLLTSRATPI